MSNFASKRQQHIERVLLLFHAEVIAGNYPGYDAGTEPTMCSLRKRVWNWWVQI